MQLDFMDMRSALLRSSVLVLPNRGGLSDAQCAREVLRKLARQHELKAPTFLYSCRTRPGTGSYSSRSATIGSTVVARRAGIAVAANATAASSKTTAPKVRASVALTPKSR